MTAANHEIHVAIVDFGMGNLFSVRRACEEMGMQASITQSREEILASDAVFLPGVGAFGDAMQTLRRLDLVEVLRDVARSEKPLIGICLGMQLLMSESEEFGRTAGLDVIPGQVVWLGQPKEASRRLKVPEVGWNEIRTPAGREGGWRGTVLEGLDDGSYLYFVHSLVVVPASDDIVISRTRYGDVDFCSTIQTRNVFACQYHPERSGPRGLRLYGNIRKFVSERVVSSQC